MMPGILRNKYFFCILISVVFIAGCAGTDGNTKLSLSRNLSLLHKDYKVAVLNFSHKYSHRKSDIGEVETPINAGEIVSKYIENELIDSKKFYVIDRENLSRVMEEHKLNLTGLTEGISTIGSLLNADGILVGEVIEFNTVKEIMNLKSTCIFTIKLIDVKSGAVIFTFNAEERVFLGTYTDALKKASEKFRDELSKVF